MALINHGSSERRCAQPAEALRTVVGTVNGCSLQTITSSCLTDFVLEKKAGEYSVQGPEIIERLGRQAVELARLSRMFRGGDVLKER